MVSEILRKMSRKRLYVLFKWIPDSLYNKVVFRLKMGYKLNLDNVKTYNEKLQYLKLYDHNPLYTVMADKLAVKEYISSVAGSEYAVPVFGFWDSFDEIDFDSLPDKFVLKCTHDSGTFFVCNNKSELDKEKLRKKFSSAMKHNYYWAAREYQYKNIKPRIIAEQLLGDGKTPVTDYKFFCFNGVPKIMYAGDDGAAVPKTAFFDMDFNPLDLTMGDEKSTVLPEKPVCFEKMKEIASLLSKGIPHLRVDFYQYDGKPYVGELTFCHMRGFAKVEPLEWNLKLGSWIDIPKEK